MNEAALLLYITTAVASASLSWNSFKHRFLPVARPLASLAFLFTLLSFIRFFELFEIEMAQWVNQVVTDLDFLIAFIIPLWIWLLIEYHQEVKTHLLDKRLLVFLIHPLVLFILVLSDIFSNGFLSQESSSTLIDSAQRIGDYASFRRVYGWSVLILFVFVTPYLMLKKQQDSFWNIIQIIVYTSLPIIFFILHRLEVINIHLAAPTFVLYMFWISRQYRLLDVMPVALKSIIDNVDSGILVSDKRSKLLYVNDYANNFLDLQLSEKELQQREQSTPALFKQHFDFSSPEKQIAQLELKPHKKGGGNKEKRYLDATLQPIFSPKSKSHLGSTVVLHDVTLRKQAELELQSFDQQKSEFFAGISHEFRTPLTLSLGHLDDVLNEVDHISKAELKDSLLQVKNNNKRLLNLVNQLLELSRLNAGSLTIQPKLIHLDSYLPRLIANFDSLADKQNIRIYLKYDQQTAHNPQLYFDSDAFEKVIINLMSNALKSMPEGGDVYIELESLDEQYLHLSIRDTGCGIPADALPKVFEMFYSHQSDNSAWPQGVGVGLSLVKQLLKQHKADIDVNSVVDEGSTFTVRFCKGFSHFPDRIDYQLNPSKGKSLHTESMSLPSFEAEAESITIENTVVLSTTDPDKQQDRDTSDPVKELVLIVEDNAEMRAYIRKHLTPNFRLIEAANGKEGLAQALQATPDLILSDVMMPKMNGYALCKQLKTNTHTSHIPVILLTAKSSQTDKLEGLELGADDYLGKPFDTKELILRIRNLIASRHSIKQYYQSNGLQKVINSHVLPKREKAFLDTLQTYAKENISKTDIKLADLANSVHMSERSLGRKLKAITGDTPKQMLLAIRLEYASKLLRNSNDSISQLSYSAGFADASHFTRSFKAHYSMTPSEYRKKNFME